MSALLERAFTKMGARLRVEEIEVSPRTRNADVVELDVSKDKKGEYFLIRKTQHTSVEVLNLQPRDRHLLLLTRVQASDGERKKSRFLLGHDERHWFVAAIPERTPVSTVNSAKEALKPEAVIATERGIRARTKHLRSNGARIRQGEWFFIPRADLYAVPLLVLRNEPLSRGSGRSHICDELYRTGGQTVYVSRRYPNGLTESEYAKLDEKTRSSARWRVMRRNARVFVRGRVRHPDHATIVLHGWHEVHMNTENRAQAMRNVAFLD